MPLQREGSEPNIRWFAEDPAEANCSCLPIHYDLLVGRVLTMGRYTSLSCIKPCMSALLSKWMQWATRPRLVQVLWKGRLLLGSTSTRLRCLSLTLWNMKQRGCTPRTVQLTQAFRRVLRIGYPLEYHIIFCISISKYWRHMHWE